MKMVELLSLLRLKCSREGIIWLKSVLEEVWEGSFLYNVMTDLKNKQPLLSLPILVSIGKKCD